MTWFFNILSVFLTLILSCCGLTGCLNIFLRLLVSLFLYSFIYFYILWLFLYIIIIFIFSRYLFCIFYLLFLYLYFYIYFSIIPYIIIYNSLVLFVLFIYLLFSLLRALCSWMCWYPYRLLDRWPFLSNLLPKCEDKRRSGKKFVCGP